MRTHQRKLFIYGTWYVRVYKKRPIIFSLSLSRVSRQLWQRVSIPKAQTNAVNAIIYVRFVCTAAVVSYEYESYKSTSQNEASSLRVGAVFCQWTEKKTRFHHSLESSCVILRSCVWHLVLLWIYLLYLFGVDCVHSVFLFVSGPLGSWHLTVYTTDDPRGICPRLSPRPLTYWKKKRKKIDSCLRKSVVAVSQSPENYIKFIKLDVAPNHQRIGRLLAAMDCCYFCYSIRIPTSNHNQHALYVTKKKKTQQHPTATK